MISACGDDNFARPDGRGARAGRSDRRVFLASFDRSARTAAADSWRDTWPALLEGRRQFRSAKQTMLDWPDHTPVACLDPWLASRESQGRAAALAYALGGDAKPIHDDLLRANSGLKVSVVLATSHGEPHAASRFAEHFLGRSGAPCESAAEATLCDGLVPAFLGGLGTAHPGLLLSAACASAAVAVGLAAERVRSGLCDVCIVVALDVLSRVAHAGFGQLGAMSAQGCRPFDRRRDGTTVGEAGAVVFMVGAGVVVPPTFAQPVEVLGFGQHCDARHPVEPSVGGVCEAVGVALRESRSSPHDLSAVYWHGTGTVQNDRTEAEAAKRIFGRPVPPGTSTKGTLGHAMGASAALSILAAAETIRSGLLPPVAGLEDPEFAHLNLAAPAAIDVRGGNVLVVALGFGGINSALILGPAGREQS